MKMFFFVGVKEFKKLNPEIINTIEKKPEFEFFEEKSGNNNVLNVNDNNSNNNVVVENKNSENNVKWKKIQRFIIIFIVIFIIIFIIVD